MCGRSLLILTVIDRFIGVGGVSQYLVTLIGLYVLTEDHNTYCH